MPLLVLFRVLFFVAGLFNLRFLNRGLFGLHFFSLHFFSLFGCGYSFLLGFRCGLRSLDGLGLGFGNHRVSFFTVVVVTLTGIVLRGAFRFRGGFGGDNLLQSRMGGDEFLDGIFVEVL
ncbi:MAG: hypothetical protein KAH56_10385, partial [Candidatus Krumholzibacteria bacterium]|nr:hypothetical protein [Candidatus Krumholzibacteria bacterium]